MTEKQRQKLCERFSQIFAVANPDPNVPFEKFIYDALLKAYLAGGEYGYEIGIDEAKDFMSKCIWGRCTDKFHANDNK